MSIQGRSYIVELSRSCKGGRCPVCGNFSTSLHGHYIRQLQGLEILNHPLTLLIKARKFRCKNKSCNRHIFCEDLSLLASPYARHTLEVEKRIREVSLKTTSRIASELLHGQNISYSQSSCLRSVMKVPPAGESPPMPVVIGIDDFAQKKGSIYGSVVVDHITRRPLAILPCREGYELDRFLGQNPQIQYITRDRGRSFMDAINRQLPGATHISDRFHLIKNMTDSLTEEIASVSRLNVHKQTYSYPCQEECRAKIMETLLNMGDARNRRKLRLFVAADNCIRKGMSISETANQMGESSNLIWRLLRHHTGKDYMNACQKNVLKHIDQLAFEISRGCIDSRKLQEKMKDSMDASAVSRATLEIRKEIKQKQYEIRAFNKSILERKNKKQGSVKSIRQFILTGKSSLQSLNRLMEMPSMKQVITLCLRFREMINGNPRQLSLRKWIEEAMSCESKAMRTFAKGIKADQQAVQNAMDIYLTNARLEGTVNKIKCIKRQMYNRASYRLLNAKIKACNK